VPPPSDPAGALARADAYLRVGPPGGSDGAVARSYLPDGRRVAWCGPVPPGWAIAIDAECAAAEPPARLVARFGRERFWERWTRAECLCKLAAAPIGAWTRRYGLDPPPDWPAVWRTLHLGDLVISVAAAPRG
jgi:hypothetical protein